MSGTMGSTNHMCATRPCPALTYCMGAARSEGMVAFEHWQRWAGSNVRRGWDVALRSERERCRVEGSSPAGDRARETPRRARATCWRVGWRAGCGAFTSDASSSCLNGRKWNDYDSVMLNGHHDDHPDRLMTEMLSQVSQTRDVLRAEMALVDVAYQQGIVDLMILLVVIAAAIPS
eukprot:2117599-Rhodomonas_salina.2